MELRHHISHNFLLQLKSVHFQHGFWIEEEPEVTWCQIGRVGRLSKKWSVVLDQEILDWVGGQNEWTLVVKLPVLCHAHV